MLVPTLVRQALAGTAVAIAALLSTASASAQQPYPNLPPPPPPPPNAQPNYPPPQQQQGPPNVYYAPAPPPAYYAPPPAVVYIEPEPPTHAPKYALWLGGRLSLLGFGGNFYQNEYGKPETTGNFAKSGPSLALDIGARLGKRYIPYLGLELSALAPGHRFDGRTDVTATSTFAGIGFRYVAGDVDSAGFLSDISFGVRTVTVAGGGETFKMSSLELFRLGLGAEIRLTTHFSISPLFMISGGVMTDTQGNITYGANGSKDGLVNPTYNSGLNIDQQATYLVVSIGCGAHFDLLGK
jgi:hypothetical protein